MTMTGADLVVEALTEHGVRHVFGLPGDTSLSWYQALARARGIRHVLCRDERAAAFMADGYAKVSGRPGVCEGPSGGGVLYLLGGVSEADGARIPLIVLTTDIPRSSLDRGSLTELKQEALFSPLSRFSTRVSQPSQIKEAVHRAFRHARAPRQGAAHVAFPEDILSAPLPTISHQAPAHVPAGYPLRRLPAPAPEVEEVAAWLMGARRPLILAGGGTLSSGAEHALSQLANRTQVAVATTITGKGSFCETQPLALGVVGANGGTECRNALAQQADLVLALGTRLNSTATLGGHLFAAAQRLIQVDLDGAQLGNTHAVARGVQADVKAFLEQLLAVSPATEGRDQEWLQAVAACPEGGECVPVHGTADALHPRRVVEAMQAGLPPDAIIAFDAGTATPYIAAYYPAREAGRHFLSTRTHGALGYALPAAMGARIAAPTRTCVAVVGDGGLGMSLSELETVTRLDLPLIIVLLRNDSYGWIECLEDIYGEEGRFGVHFGNQVNYEALAHAFQLRYHRVQEPHALTQALEATVRDGSPLLLEVRVRSLSESDPPVARWQQDRRLPFAKRRRESY